MEHLEGCHGTSAFRAHQIEKNGFKVSRGRGGTGIYFWRKSGYYRELAIAWFKQLEAQGTFRREPKVACAVIYVQIEVSNDQLLDLEDPDVKDQIETLSKQRHVDTSKDGEIAALYDLFVSELEKELGNSILVTIIRVAPPKNYFGYPIKMLGAPICFIARDAHVPKVLRTEILD